MDYLAYRWAYHGTRITILYHTTCISVDVARYLIFCVNSDKGGIHMSVNMRVKNRIKGNKNKTTKQLA